MKKTGYLIIAKDEFGHNFLGDSRLLESNTKFNSVKFWISFILAREQDLFKNIEDVKKEIKRAHEQDYKIKPQEVWLVEINENFDESDSLQQPFEIIDSIPFTVEEQEYTILDLFSGKSSIEIEIKVKI